MNNQPSHIPDYIAHLYTEDSRNEFVDFEIGEAFIHEYGHIYIPHRLGSLILIPYEQARSVAKMQLRRPNVETSLKREAMHTPIFQQHNRGSKS